MPGSDVVPLSAAADQLLDVLERHVGPTPCLRDWLRELSAAAGDVAVAAAIDPATVDSEVSARLGRQAGDGPLSRERLAERVSRRAAMAGHPLATGVDVVRALLETDDDTSGSAVTVAVEDGTCAPLSWGAEELLTSVFAGDVTRAPADVLTLLVEQHRDDIAGGADLDLDALVADVRRTAATPLARAALARRAGLMAAQHQRPAATRVDVAAAVLASVRPALPDATREAPRTSPPAPTEERVVRVFVSSTFRDMHDERDELVKRTFPQLRRLCESRGVTWGEVDLRWGITDEQKAEGKVLPICLAEIRNCRPYFIGLLGDRYGWVPDDIDPGLLQEHPWLGDCRGLSVTELEIRHGALNDPRAADHSFFYLRARSFADSLAPDERVLFTEESEDNRRRLAELKDRVRASGLPVREDYADARTLGRLVLDDLAAVIERDYPKGSEPDWLGREAAEHRVFARSRAAVYIGRADYYRRLDAHVDGDGPPLVVLGESGSGKSALLANWALRREAVGGQPPLVHFIGATPLSADWTVMLRRVIGELARGFDLPLEVPDQPDALRETFANTLHRAATKGRVVLVLDALNQLEDREGAPDLVWLPPVLPAGVRLIVSTLPGRALDEIQRRAWPAMHVEPLTADERTRLVTDYLAPRTLSTARLKRLTEADQTANPLYLRELLEELRVWGDHFRLDEQLDRCLEARTTKELFAKILARYAQDYERDRPGLVADAMSLIWAARRGIAESELLDLLGADGRPLPRALWSPLFVAAEHSLASRGGLITFSHDYLRAAVADTYLPDEEHRRATRLRLADYFAAQPLGPRKVAELPWQLARAQAWPRLYDVLADPDFLLAAWDADEFDVKARWAELEAASSLRLVDAYAPVLADPGEYGELVTWRVERLLDETSHPDEAMRLLRWQEEAARAGDEAERLALALSRQGILLFERGDFAAAMALAKEHEALCRRLGDEGGLLASLTNQANILFRRGELDDAMALHQEAERLCRARGDRDGLQRCLGNQANILHERGDTDGAIALHREEERICRELGDPVALQGALGNLAIALADQGDLDGALALIDEKEHTCREIGYRAGLARALGGRAAVLLKQGDLAQALDCFEQTATIARDLHDTVDLVVSLEAQAAILRELGDLDGAMARFEEQVRACREVDDRRRLQRALGLLALLHLDRGELDRAIERFQEQEVVCRELGDPDELEAALNNQAVALKRNGDLAAAMVLHEEVESICRSRDDLAGVARSLTNQGLVVMHQGDPDRALSLLGESERISRELDDSEAVVQTMVNEAAAMSHASRAAEAERTLLEARRFAADHGLDDLVHVIDLELPKLSVATPDIESLPREDAPVRGLTAPTRLDLALQSPTGEVVLGVVATGDWAADARLLGALRAKLEAHAEFARSPECVQRLGAPATRILLMTTHEPTPEVQALLREVSAATGMPIDVERSSDMPEFLSNGT